MSNLLVKYMKGRRSSSTEKKFEGNIKIISKHLDLNIEKLKQDGAAKYIMEEMKNQSEN